MFVDAIAAISQRYDDTVRPLADDLRRLFGRYRPLQHRERLNIDHTLPDDDSRGMVRLCASKNNAPSDSPAIALNIACGAIKLGDSDPIDSWSDIGVSWAKATANWTNASGNNSYVDCNKATDRAGTLGTGTVRVYLPRAGGKDPNVRSGETIAYFLDPNGVAVAAGSYLDDKIGSVRMWAGASGSVPGGWAIMNGSQGGSGLNANGRFLEGITSGSVGVAAASGTSASGTASITVASDGGGGTIDSAPTGISISAHAASAGADLSHAAAAGGADLAHAANAGGAALAHSGNAADLEHAASGTDVAHANGASTDLNAGTYTADFADGGGDDSVKVIDPDFPHSINFADYVAAHTDDSIVAAISDHSAADVAGALNDHTKAEVAAALADHTKADVAAALDDHTKAEVVGCIADHSVTDSGHTHTASGLAHTHGATDAGHTHGPGTLEPQSIQLFLIERVS